MSEARLSGLISLLLVVQSGIRSIRQKMSEVVSAASGIIRKFGEMRSIKSLRI